jgi:hypothetical protein
VRVLITGSRSWTGVQGEARIQTILNIVLALCDVLGVKLTIVHGDCPDGADAAADRWAVRREADGVHVERHPADWNRNGKAAGPLRNAEMVKLGADLCIGFHRGDSRGTAHTLALARSAGIPTFTVHWDEA